MLVLKREEVTHSAQFKVGDAGYQWGGTNSHDVPKDTSAFDMDDADFEEDHIAGIYKGLWYFSSWSRKMRNILCETVLFKSRGVGHILIDINL